MKDSQRSHSSEPHRLEFGQFVDKVFWSVIIVIAGYTARSINELNEKIAIVITQVSFQEKRIDGQEARLQSLEVRNHRK